MNGTPYSLCATQKKVPQQQPHQQTTTATITNDNKKYDNRTTFMQQHQHSEPAAPPTAATTTTSSASYHSVNIVALLSQQFLQLSPVSLDSHPPRRLCPRFGITAQRERRQDGRCAVANHVTWTLSHVSFQREGKARLV